MTSSFSASSAVSCVLVFPETVQGKELKAPEEKVVFEEDLSPEEKAKILKEKPGPRSSQVP